MFIFYCFFDLYIIILFPSKKSVLAPWRTVEGFCQLSMFRQSAMFTLTRFCVPAKQRAGHARRVQHCAYIHRVVNPTCSCIFPCFCDPAKQRADQGRLVQHCAYIHRVVNLLSIQPVHACSLVSVTQPNSALVKRDSYRAVHIFIGWSIFCNRHGGLVVKASAS